LEKPYKFKVINISLIKIISYIKELLEFNNSKELLYITTLLGFYLRI